MLNDKERRTKKMARWEEAYCVVRKAVDDGHEWFDFRTISGDRENCQRLADENTKNSFAIWLHDNPQVRVAKILICSSHPYLKAFLDVNFPDGEVPDAG